MIDVGVWWEGKWKRKQSQLAFPRIIRQTNTPTEIFQKAQ